MYFLIPYYLIKYEKTKSLERKKQLTDEYKILYNGIQEAYNKGEISAYDKCNIVTFTNCLLEYLYPEDVAAEGVKSMGGTILRTDADEILEKGLVIYIENIMTNLKMTVDQAMDALSIPESERARYKMLIKQQ